MAAATVVGGDLASTGMEKPGARAEAPSLVKIGKISNANDTDHGYALAA